jgi:hypothetical protein
MFKLAFGIATVMFVAAAAVPARADVKVVDDGATLTVDCAKEKVVYISGEKVNIVLSGTCDAVNISSDGSTVKGSVLQLNISGDGNTFVLDAVDQIMVSGDRNTITYKKAVKAKKTGVMSTGSNNKISQVK